VGQKKRIPFCIKTREKRKKKGLPEPTGHSTAATKTPGKANFGQAITIIPGGGNIGQHKRVAKKRVFITPWDRKQGQNEKTPQPSANIAKRREDKGGTPTPLGMSGLGGFVTAEAKLV